MQNIRQVLIQAIHSCAVKFDEVASSVADLLLDFLGDFNSSSAVDVIAFIKEVVEIFPKLRPSIISRLLETLKNVHSGSVYRGALWVLGEYCVEEHDIQEAWVHIRLSIGEMPIYSSNKRRIEGGGTEEGEGENGSLNGSSEHHHTKSAPRVLADGTYATESALTATESKYSDKDKNDRPPLRALILDGSYFVAAVLATTLTKLVLRYSKISDNVRRKNALRAEALLIMTSILRVGESDIVSQKIDEDSVDRILSCIRTLAEGQKDVEQAFLDDTKSAFKVLVQAKQRKQQEENADELRKNATSVDSPISFRQLSRVDGDELVDVVEQDISKAASSGADGISTDLSHKLKSNYSIDWILRSSVCRSIYECSSI